jgi:hypothetical protein
MMLFDVNWVIRSRHQHPKSGFSRLGHFSLNGQVGNGVFSRFCLAPRDARAASFVLIASSRTVRACCAHADSLSNIPVAATAA